jgi:hypothetical protein
VSLIATVEVAALGRAIKSAEVFVGPRDQFQAFDYIRLYRKDDQLYFVAGDRYSVAAVRIPTQHSFTDFEDEFTELILTRDSLHNALASLKPGRAKPLIDLNEDELGGITLVRHDDLSNSIALDRHVHEYSKLPPAFQAPMAPIIWGERYNDEDGNYGSARFAVQPDLIVKVARASWNNTDAIIVEAGTNPAHPITIRIGHYLIAVLAPKDGANGNDTTVAPNAGTTRDSWYEALTDMHLTPRSNDAKRPMDQPHSRA